MTNPTDIGARIAQLVADAVNCTDPQGTDGQPPYGVHRVNDAFVRITANVTGGVITLDVREIDMGGDDRAVRMILQPSTPVPIDCPAPPEPAPEPSPVGVMDQPDGTAAA